MALSRFPWQRENRFGWHFYSFYMKYRLLVGCLLLTVYACAQDTAISPSLLRTTWPASWIACPGAPARDYGVYHFRKTFHLDIKPDHYLIHVSGDNRYRLFVNGKPVCSGPARGDLYNWYFETVDIAPFLQAGENTLAALVWNMGVYAPVAQISNRTAFVLQGDAENALVNTNTSWKVLWDTAYAPCSTDNGPRLRAYMVTGPGDRVNGALYPWGWEQPGFDDHAWRNAESIAGAEPLGSGSDNGWCLVQRNIPLMEETMERIPMVRRAAGWPVAATADVASAALLTGASPLHIPPHTNVSLLLDQTHNTVAYPELVVSGGRHALIKLQYAEALVDNHGQKGNRDDITGKTLVGDYDLFEPDGGEQRRFRPLWFRTFRYVQVDISTGDDSLVVEDLYGMYTGYPFERKATFASNDTSLASIWNVGWRTARLCAGETYFDCPYYEQLQYEADTRIQSLISLYAAGDDRLMRKALIDFYNSRVPEGLTQGRYPSNRLQVIPPFSLFWVSMVYDYWMHRKDDAFTGHFLTAIRGVLDWYERHIGGPMPWWNFVDWADAFGGGTPDGASDGHSSIVTLQYAYTLRQASKLFDYFGDHGQAAHYEHLADSLCRNTYRTCFDPVKMEMANTPEKKGFSQHAGIMAILAGAIPRAGEKDVIHQLLHDSTLEQATFYYRFYLNQAMKKAGMADLYYAQLTPWRNMLQRGLTTFAEKSDPTRSDCHAWSASPEYDFLATICGIMPDAPGFEKVLVQPALGELKEVTGAMPHPLGMITVHFKRVGKGLQGEVSLPRGLKGRLVYGGREMALHEGKQVIAL